MREPGKRVLKKVLHPLRAALGRFAIRPPSPAELFRDTIIYKAGRLIAAEKIRGDYYEFGVYRGAHFCAAYHQLRFAFQAAATPGPWNTPQDCAERLALWESMRFVAFDSFQGLPAPRGPDQATCDFAAGKYACSQADFEASLREAAVPAGRVSIVPGWFQDSLTPATAAACKLGTAAIVTVDSDYYESAKLVLSFVTPLLTAGSVIVFDDWYGFRGDPSLGEQRACREWVAENPRWDLADYQKEGPWRNSFIVVPKA